MASLGPRKAQSLTDANLLRIVKFDTEALPPILNALETENAGQKLILEVAVRLLSYYPPSVWLIGLLFNSNIWVKM